MKKYKLFLASSGELAMERKETALMISRLNNAWVDKNIYLELVIWEELLQSFRGERIQDYFNREMLKCDIVVVLFFKKVGQFTKEEFHKAYESLKKGKKPHFLFVYFKKGQIDIDDADDEDILKRIQFKKEIQKYEQIYQTFGSIEGLTQSLKSQLEQVILHKQAEIAEQDEAVDEERAKYDLENYKQHLEQKFKYLDFTGLNAILQKPLELENIYVKLRAKKSHYSWPENLEEPHFKEKDEDFVTVFNQLHQQNQDGRMPLKMLILGKPGSGKTTLMKWITLQCLKDKSGFFSRFVPVFLSLNDLGGDPAGTFRKKNIGSLVVDLLEKENISIDSFFEEQFKSNRLLFLLDGLDEIGDEKTRREVIQWIQKQYIAQNSVIITSRFSGINPKEGLAFRDEIPVFTVQDFQEEDVHAFLQNWYRAIELAVAGGRGTQKAVEEAEKKSGDLIATIKKFKNLAELAVNPLLLTIIAVVHRTRAVLPRERYKLYEECLKVMIELWNLSNRKVDISFSFDNSISHLSAIAARLMDTNRREMEKKEIDECCLPAKIEGQTRDFFIKEMVLKAGLLYESEGKYGFLHLTFQEYLAARHFADSRNQNGILKYHEKGYWSETFKLFVNIGNAELFFEEIIENLLSKKYWKQIEFWEDCIEEIVKESVKGTIELSFAWRVIEILAPLKFIKENEALIEKVFFFKPLYKHGGQLVKEGWELFNNAPHPFVQSIGTSILNRADNKTRAELVEQLMHRIDGFEKRKDESNKTHSFFQLQNNISFSLLFARRRNLKDFSFALEKLKSGNVFLQYLSFLTLLILSNFRSFRALRFLRTFRDLLALRAYLTILDFLALRDLLGLLDLPELLNIRYSRYLPTFTESISNIIKNINRF